MVRDAEAWFIFSCFENEMFRSWNRGEAEREKKNEWNEKSFYSRVPCSPSSNQTMAILGTAVFSKSRLDWLLTLLPLPSNDIPVWWTRSGTLNRPRMEGKRKNIVVDSSAESSFVGIGLMSVSLILRRGRAAVVLIWNKTGCKMGKKNPIKKSSLDLIIYSTLKTSVRTNCPNCRRWY